MLLYLDNCCYNRPFDDQEQVRVHIETVVKLHIQELIRAGKLKLACSFVSRFENSKNPNESNRESITAFFQNAAVYVGREHFDEIKKKRDKYMTMGIKMKDAT
ncbi:MAG: hypothetical protein LBU65_14400, partial [Planctomycetaceae bacterium]|nr:hypothetical protein [Planctomycetaceae bacterium]